MFSRCSSASRPKIPMRILWILVVLVLLARNLRHAFTIFVLEDDSRPYRVCFVTSVFAPSADAADRPPNVSSLQQPENADVRFFAYTNLQDLDAPGWSLQRKNFPYKRYITHSRWGKFMSWNDTLIYNHCQTVFYVDGYLLPRADKMKRFRKIARQVKRSKYGLAQNPHRDASGGVYSEFQRVLDRRKDIPANVQASIAWLEAQHDFRNCTLYNNKYFAFDPTNPYFQEASSFFWSHYSLEKDSWRDQPLWCYVLHRFSIHPIRLDKELKLFENVKDRRRRHVYTHEANENAVNQSG